METHFIIIIIIMSIIMLQVDPTTASLPYADYYMFRFLPIPNLGNHDILYEFAKHFMNSPIMLVSSASTDEISALHTPCSRNQSCSHNPADKQMVKLILPFQSLIINSGTCGNAY